MAQSSFTQLLNPRRNPLAAMHCNSIANRLKKSLQELDIKEALGRLPRETVEARNQSAMDLSMKHAYLPDHHHQLLNPRRNPLVAMHCNSIANHLKKSLEELDIKEALARLPRETVDARNQSAMDLSMKHAYLPDHHHQALQTPFRGNLQPMTALDKTTAKTDRLGLAGAGSFKSMNFIQSILEEDEQCSRENKIDFVHVLLNKKKSFVAVTDVKRE